MSHLNIVFEQGASPLSWAAQQVGEDQRRVRYAYPLVVAVAVLLAHIGLFAWLTAHTSNREISLTSVAPPATLRVSIVAAAPPPPEPPVVVAPPPPAPQVMTSDAALRTTAINKPKPLPKPRPQPKPKPVPAMAQPEVAKAEPVNSPPVPAAPPPGEASEKLLELPTAGPKDVQTVGCRVPAPDYPRNARRQRVQGNVLVRMVIDIDGRIQSATVARSSGNEELDEAARKAVSAASCAPYVENGRTIAVRAAQPVSFRLDR